MRHFESLELRRLLTVSVLQQGNWLWIDGSAGNDKITIEDAGSDGLRVRDNGVSLGAKYGVDHVILETFAGQDQVFITSGKTNVLFQIDLGSGNDYIEPGYGNHFITGGSGADGVSYAKFGIDMYITNHDGNWTGYRTSSGVTHEDKLAADVEKMWGGSGNDVIFGNNAPNTLYGGAGNDMLFGLASGDYLSGDNGNDSMWGHEGDDYLVGGNGVDSMVGGRGSDIFYSRDGGSVDTIIGDNLWGVNVPATFDRVFGDVNDLLSSHEWSELI